MTLDERKKLILESIIKDYVETAEPVGSRAVVKKHGLKISAATVRNEMSDLEDMGYLEQPYTSAGRIPSQKGFRYYVDCMMEQENLDDKETEVLLHLLDDSFQEVNDLVQKIGHFLAQITNYTSFVIVPSVRLSKFKYLQLIPIEPGKALVLLVTDLGVVMHRNIEVPHSITAPELDLMGRMFNQVLAGKKITEIQRSDLQQLRDELKQRRKVIDHALEAIESLLDNSNEERVIISGALNIMNEPEFKDVDKLKKIMAFLEEETQLMDMLPESLGDEVDIRIGQENQAEDFKELSLVFAGYRSQGEQGKLGLMGPVRMEYWKAVGSLDSVREIIEEIIRKRF
ncbi:MAG: heat-inducible transcriptional repressor HrcA [Syntrophomonadaceae bacterium]|nr:heat-inducible transcriptional repressor HrcA [Syntrophomonadaceae bacterium]MDD3271567.1 heat-inducible transcriptional repressor HrcA [Syntrophomonadaceae bacterium]MDD3898423.1 heat-inducible transcriptional repressor HrcA [Syntrophomonadaceae bacterium]MDD4562555.1 heat-inducible transcriptional repressor HrcA [Syntrophomonadaceae bacterium]